MLIKGCQVLIFLKNVFFDLNICFTLTNCVALMECGILSGSSLFITASVQGFPVTEDLNVNCYQITS